MRGSGEGRTCDGRRQQVRGPSAYLATASLAWMGAALVYSVDRGRLWYAGRREAYSIHSARFGDTQRSGVGVGAQGAGRLWYTHISLIVCAMARSSYMTRRSSSEATEMLHSTGSISIGDLDMCACNLLHLTALHLSFG